MDLVALASEDGKLHVLRLNGQRVFGDFGDLHGDGGGSRVRLLTWKPDGKKMMRYLLVCCFPSLYCGLRLKPIAGHSLVVGCTDNDTRILNAYSGKTVHYLTGHSASSLPANRNANISCIGWGVNFTDSKAAREYLETAEGKLSVEDILTTDAQLPNAAQLKADLPRELALLDIETSLPKLSTLPTTGNESVLFSPFSFLLWLSIVFGPCTRCISDEELRLI